MSISIKKASFCAGLWVCLWNCAACMFIGEMLSPVQVPQGRQFLYPAVTEGIVNPTSYPCSSVDAQYPTNPCSPPQELPNLAYVDSNLFQYTSTPVPQVSTYPFLINPIPSPQNYPLNGYPYTNLKQIGDKAFPTIPDDEVPSQYV